MPNSIALNGPASSPTPTIIGRFWLLDCRGTPASSREDGVSSTHEQPWPDWRNGDPAHVRAMLTWPIERVLLDVEHWHWRPSWGARPASVTEAARTARNRLSLAPSMVPV